MKILNCKIKSKNKAFQQYLKNGRKITDFEIVDKEAAELSEMIPNRKEKYFYDLSLKVNNPQTSPKTYWSIIKSCYNGRKAPIIPPLSANGKIQKIKHVLQNQNYHLSILRMKIYTK